VINTTLRDARAPAVVTALRDARAPADQQPRRKRCDVSEEDFQRTMRWYRTNNFGRVD
jgi:hypothetical protein